jgi:hypothetical protein
MEKKQTAVKWLWQWIMKNPLGSFGDGVKAYNKAKQMEKEQIINFAMHLHKVDMSKTGTDILMEEAEQYYNKTYGTC